MPVEIGRQQNSPQVRVSVKYDADQIVSFALVPIRRPPDMRYSRNVSVVLAQKHFQPQTIVMFRPEKMIIDLKS